MFIFLKTSRYFLPSKVLLYLLINVTSRIVNNMFIFKISDLSLYDKEYYYIMICYIKLIFPRKVFDTAQC